MDLKKINIFAVQDGQFHPWVVADSDYSQDAKSLFWALYKTPSKLVPTNEEAKKYTGIKSTAKLRRAYKELEIRGTIEYVSGGLILRDRVLPAPAEEILPLKGGDKVKPEPKLQEEFRTWYMSWFMKRFGERYPWAFGKDNAAAIRLIQNYGLEGAKAKVITADEYRAPNGGDQRFFNNAAKSLTTLASVASRLVQSQIDRITDPNKWDIHKQHEIKL